MSLRTQVVVWVGFFLAAILLLWVFRPILLPFVVGLALAYILNPVVTWLQKAGLGRSWATALILLLVISVIVGLLFMLVPLVGEQAIELAARLPAYIADLQRLAQDVAPQFASWIGAERVEQIEDSLTDLISRGVEIAGSLTAIVATSGLNVLNTLFVLFIAPVVAFYLLLEWEGMMRRVDDLLPRAHLEEIRGVLHDIDRAMAGVIRGQGGVILVLTIYYSTALTLVGLNFGLAIGIIGGLLSFVPFVGFITGFVLSMAVAMVQFGPSQWVLVLIVLSVYIVGQFLEANILYPKLVGQSINLNPVWLMFALFAFALLFGFVGLLVAVPLSAIAGVLARYALRKYQNSTLYLGSPLLASAKTGEVDVAEAAAPLPASGAQRKPARRRPGRAG